MEQTSKKTIVSLKDIFIKFDGEVILNHINLDINEKEFVTILGRQAAVKPQPCASSAVLLNPTAAMSFSAAKELTELLRIKEM